MPIPLDLQGSNKVQITRTPQVAPSQCVVCGFSGEQEGRYYIDFGIDIEFYGTILVCTDCFGEVAKLVDYDSPFISLKKSDVIEKILDENSRLKGIEAKYNAIVDTVGVIHGDDLGTPDSVINPAQIDEKRSRKSRQPNSDSANLIDEAAKLINESGHTDVLDNAGSIQSLDL